MILPNQLEDSDIRADTYVIGIVIEHQRKYKGQDQSKISC